MNNIKEIKKKIIFRSEYRGLKEMDILLGGFVKKYINDFNMTELKQLAYLLTLDDDNLLKWYQNMKQFFLELGQKMSAIKIQSFWRKYMFKKYGYKLLLNNGEQN